MTTLKIAWLAMLAGLLGLNNLHAQSTTTNQPTDSIVQVTAEVGLL